MPQKKNPDAAELMRAAAPRLAADLGGLLGVLHGLPLAYNTDLREDKRYLFDAVDCLDLLLPVVDGLLEGVVFNEARMAAACDPYLAATDVADYLVGKGVPFREAHHLTGTLVRRCLEAGEPLAQVPLEDLRSLSPAFDDEYYDLHEPAAQLARKCSRGGSAPLRVREQLELALAALDAHLCC
jgi:argininosuccinate lyase